MDENFPVVLIQGIGKGIFVGGIHGGKGLMKNPSWSWI